MLNELFMNTYRTPSSRASWHSYDGGIYHITICTESREYYFGQIVDDILEPKMVLSRIGLYVEEQLKNVGTHYSYAQIPLFVVMPNHIHAIIVIDGEKWDAHQMEMMNLKMASSPKTSSDPTMKKISSQKGPLSIVVGGFKRAVTMFAKLNQIPFVWQERFHDRIIRNQTELNQTAIYINQNVSKWHEDELNKMNVL